MTSMDAHEMPSGTARANSPSGRDSSSSRSSEAYTPLPPGHWILNVHGNCSRCHHHHSSARIKVNVPRNPCATTHVRCQGCRGKWLAIGGHNQTQLSLLSVNSVLPDPAAISVQHSLVDIVRSSTAIAALSPSLARITELPPSMPPSRQQSFHVASIDTAQADEPPESQSLALPMPISPGNIPAAQPQVPGRASTPPLVQPSNSQRYGLHTGRRFSHIKETLGLRFPALHRANWTPRIGIMRQTRTPASRVRKHPVRTEQPVEAPTITNQILDVDVQEGRSAEQSPQEQGEQDSDSLARPSTPSDTAIHFRATLGNDSTNLGALTQKEKAAWIRTKYTEFRNRSLHLRAIQPMVSGAPISIDIVAAPPQYEQGNTPQRHSHDLMGLGSHHGRFDRFWPVQTSTISISSRSISPRISEAETAIEEPTTAPSSPRFSWPMIAQRERADSPRPSSITVHTLRHLRRSGEIHY